jgi:hypothetical protein
VSLEKIGIMEAVLTQRFGPTIGKSILSRNLARAKKDSGQFTPEDIQLLIRNVLFSASVFLNKEELSQMESRLREIWSS